MEQPEKAALDCGNISELSRGPTQRRRRSKLSSRLRDVNLKTSEPTFRLNFQHSDFYGLRARTRLKLPEDVPRGEEGLSFTLQPCPDAFIVLQLLPRRSIATVVATGGF